MRVLFCINRRDCTPSPPPYPGVSYFNGGLLEEGVEPGATAGGGLYRFMVLPIVKNCISYHVYTNTIQYNKHNTVCMYL